MPILSHHQACSTSSGSAVSVWIRKGWVAAYCSCLRAAVEKNNRIWLFGITNWRKSLHIHLVLQDMAPGCVYIFSANIEEGAVMW
jgi:hypothetical protein